MKLFEQQKISRLFMGGFLALGLSAGAVTTAYADSISPATFTATLGVGESVTINKTVTVDEGTPTTALVDVFFLADSTGSMFGEIAAVKTSASGILSSTAGLGDVAFGVGEYRDTGDAFVYRTNADLTTSQATAQTGINAWTAAGGGDFYEANLYALETVAKTISWRPGSTRLLVWFGDAPGHDPRLGSTEASATAALVAEDIAVLAIDVGSLNLTGQAKRIADATDGTYYAGISTGTIVDTIKDAITESFATYSTVALDTSDVLPGVTVAVAPGSYAGSYDRETTRTFDFSVTFTGDTAGTYEFPIYATVDGGRVATERDTITVRASSVPEPASLVLLGLGLAGLGLARWRKMA